MSSERSQPEALPILLVEDDPFVLTTLQMTVRSLGFRAISATTVTHALKLVHGNRLGAAIVDWELGPESGLAVLHELRRQQPSCARLLCTGRQDLSVFVDAVNHGEVDRIVRKPFRIGELALQLEEAMAAVADRERVAANRLIAQDGADRSALDEVLRSPLPMAVQPIVHRDSVGTARYFEALLRPDHGLLGTPTALLAAAERQGRVVEAGGAALRSALGLLQGLPPDTGLFVNLHPEQLSAPAPLLHELERTAIHAGITTLEITERSRLQTIPDWQGTLKRIEELGYSIAVDDLGAGYNSLTILADLNPSFIKLDMSLVRDLDRAPHKQRLVQLMASFAEATGSKVIAEGVERQGEADALVDCGIELLQGYLYGRPARASWDRARGSGVA